MSAVAGRRTYTEDELQAALRDIQSGKLGTRRAAVIYGIPRSTLRNKVYKLALERERESHLLPAAAGKLDEEEAMDDDKELSGAEEEKEVERALRGPLLSMADIVRFSGLDATGPEALRTLLQSARESGGGGQDLWTGGLEPGKVAPYLQGLILASQNLLASKPDPPPDFMKHMMADEALLLKEQLKLQPQQHHLQQQQQHHHHHHQHHHQQHNGDRLPRPSPSNSVITRVERARSESDMETEESSSSVILKIPSFKPSKSGGGETVAAAFRGALDSSCSLASPPVTSESGSPPIMPPAVGKPPQPQPPTPTPVVVSTKDVRDVIAHTISQKFQQALEPQRRPPLLEMDFKRGGFTPPALSAIKAQEGPRSYQSPSQSQQQQHQQQQQAGAAPKGGSGGPGSGTGGGKGTRPKRGKYRNYDRDSLVEAVRAVQRGEMSVHRAGSYYGVPHSTLEYKVKERHLMRPRKRDPKPNPVDEKIASLKQSELRAAAAAAAATVGPSSDKLKPPGGVVPMKPPSVGGGGGGGQKFPPGSPNGLKLPLFEAPPLPGYNPPPFPFWPPPGFPPLPMEYRSFQPPEYFASQMMQKLQEESARGGAPTSAAAALPKSARQMAESLLDGSGANGSFLDGIIRSSLESGVPVGEDGRSPPCREEQRNTAPENMSNKALLDQLCRNSRLTPLSRPVTTMGVAAEAGGSPGEDSYKGSSPLNFSTGPSSAEDKTSPPAFDGRDAAAVAASVGPGELPTIELSNDSSESADRRRADEEPRRQLPNATTTTTTATATTPLARIYLKQELAKPENLKPEMLVRFGDDMPDVEENGIGETTGSASDD